MDNELTHFIRNLDFSDGKIIERAKHLSCFYEDDSL